MKKEIWAGLTTFFTMSYIVFVNPSILATEGTGMPFSGVLTATVLLCFSMTLLMGVYAKIPFAIAPGMGINAYFTYSIILGKQIPWPIALGIVFWSGVLFLLISITPLRVAIARSIPKNLRIASACGIGIFLTFIGLKNAGVIQSDPVTFVKMGKINIQTLLFLEGLLVILLLWRKKNPFSFLAGIGAVSLTAFFLGKINLPEHFFSVPDFTSVLFKMDALGALKIAFIPAIIGIFFTDLFDSISTFVGVSHSTGLVDQQGEPKRLREGLIVDAWATLTAGVFGTSSGTAYIESAAGIEAGGRTGKTAIVTAFCFLPCLFIAPLVGLVPSYATAPVLVIVGALMFQSIKELQFGKVEDLLPAFLTTILIPLTFSITQGLLVGFLSHCLLYILAGRFKELSKTTLMISACALILFAIENS